MSILFQATTKCSRCGTDNKLDLKLAQHTDRGYYQRCQCGALLVFKHYDTLDQAQISYKIEPMWMRTTKLNEDKVKQERKRKNDIILKGLKK